jgi:hypothetical protein
LLQTLEQIRHRQIRRIRNVEAAFVRLQSLLDCRQPFSIKRSDAPYDDNVLCAGLEL